MRTVEVDAQPRVVEGLPTTRPGQLETPRARQLEARSVVLAVTAVEVTVFGFLLILLPLILQRRRWRSISNKLPVLLHFPAIGIGFMFVEIAYIQIFTRFLGDPLLSASAVITSLLVSAGVGSLVQRRLVWPQVRRIRVAAVTVAVLSLLYLWKLEAVLGVFAGAGPGLRYLLTGLFLLPLAFFMGWLFPAGLAIFNDGTLRAGGPRAGAPRLVALAWGVNGFASVSAAPLAMMVGMSAGLPAVLLAAAGFYLLTAAISFLWKV